MSGLIAQTTQQHVAGGDGFHWWLAVPWVFTLASVVLNIYQWRHARIRKVKPTFETKSFNDPAHAHKRFFTFTVDNKGVDLYRIGTALICRVGGIDRNIELKCLGDLPEKLTTGQPCMFYLENVDPRTSYGIDALPVSDVSLVFYVGGVPVETIRGKKLKAALDEFSRVNESLPPKPVQPQRATGVFPDPLSWERKW